MKARELMHSELLVVTPDQPVSVAAELMLTGDVGMIPVIGDPLARRLVGVITDRDIATRHVGVGHRQECAVRDHMTPLPLAVVRPDDHVHDVAGRMRHVKVRRIPVVGNDHELLGVIAIADIVRGVGVDEPRLVEDVMLAVSEPELAHA